MKRLSFQKGSLLLELLIVIALLAIILSVGSEVVFVSLQSGKVSGERDVAVGLASESLEAVRGASEEKWLNIYTLSGKGSTHYQATSTVLAGKWTIISGDETIRLNNATYTRYVIVDNVSRDGTTRAIEPSYVSADDDPSTQKVTVTVSWPNADPVTMSEYFFRWKNKVCYQSSWVGNGTPGNSIQTCGTNTTFDTIDATATTTGGTLKLI